MGKLCSLLRFNVYYFQRKYLVRSSAAVQAYENFKEAKHNTLTKEWYCSSIDKNKYPLPKKDKKDKYIKLIDSIWFKV